VIDNNYIREIYSCIHSMNKVGLKPNLNNLLFEHVGGYDWTFFDELIHRIYKKEHTDVLTDKQIVSIIDLFLETIKGS